MKRPEHLNAIHRKDTPMAAERTPGFLPLVVCAGLLIFGWTLDPSFLRTASVMAGIGAGLGGVWMLTLKYASR